LHQWANKATVSNENVPWQSSWSGVETLDTLGSHGYEMCEARQLASQLEPVWQGLSPASADELHQRKRMSWTAVHPLFFGEHWKGRPGTKSWRGAALLGTGLNAHGCTHRWRLQATGLWKGRYTPLLYSSLCCLEGTEMVISGLVLPERNNNIIQWWGNKCTTDILVLAVCEYIHLMLLHNTAGDLANGPDRQYYKINGIILASNSKAESIMTNWILLINSIKFNNTQKHYNITKVLQKLSWLARASPT
jgi:hypothetical protein